MDGFWYELALALMQALLCVAVVCLIIDVISVADYRRALRAVRGRVGWGRGEVSVIEELNKRMHGFETLYYKFMFSGVVVGGAGLASEALIIKVVWCVIGLCVHLYGWWMHYEPGNIVRESEELLKAAQDNRPS